MAMTTVPMAPMRSTALVRRIISAVEMGSALCRAGNAMAGMIVWMGVMRAMTLVPIYIVTIMPLNATICFAFASRRFAMVSMIVATTRMNRIRCVQRYPSAGMISSSARTMTASQRTSAVMDSTIVLMDPMRRTVSRQSVDLAHAHRFALKRRRVTTTASAQRVITRVWLRMPLVWLQDRIKYCC